MIRLSANFLRILCSPSTSLVVLARRYLEYTSANEYQTSFYVSKKIKYHKGAPCILISNRSDVLAVAPVRAPFMKSTIMIHFDLYQLLELVILSHTLDNYFPQSLARSCCQWLQLRVSFAQLLNLLLEILAAMCCNKN